MKIEKAEFYDEIKKFLYETRPNCYYCIEFDNGTKTFKAVFACHRGAVSLEEAIEDEPYNMLISDPIDYYGWISFFEREYNYIAVVKHYTNEFTEEKAEEIYKQFKIDEDIEIKQFNMTRFLLNDKYNQTFLITLSCVSQYLNYLTERYKKEHNNEPSV